MRIVSATLVVLAATSALSCSVYAADSGNPGNPRQVCKDDVHTFCADVQPGGGRIIDCLKDHYKQLSDNCYTALQKMEAHRQQQGGDNGGGNPPPPPPRGDDGEPPMNEAPPEDGNNGQ